MKGQASLVQLASEMQAVFPFFNGVENRYLEQWDRFGTSFSFGAAVGQANGFRMRNPSVSNVIAVLEKLTMSVVRTADILVQLGVATSDLPTAQSAVTIDARTQRVASSLVLTRTVVTPAALAGSLYDFNPLATTEVDVILFEDQELTILPGIGLQVTTSQANIGLVVNALWRERFLEDSERA